MSAIASMLVIFLFLFGGSQRHWGHFFVLFIVFYNIYLSFNNHERWITYFLNFALTCQVGVGIMALQKEIQHPFSNSGKVAQYIEQNYDASKVKIVGAPGYTLTPIIGQLSGFKEFHNLESGYSESFIDWNKSYKKPPYNLDLIRPENNTILLILGGKNFKSDYEWKKTDFDAGNQSFEMHKVATFKGAIVSDENYELFEIRFSD